MTKNKPIETIADLQYHLQVALQLEHATIPPYLTALYSIKQNAERSNQGSFDVIRAVVVEEMLHMTLAANLLNAVGGEPKLTEKGFVPNYPTYLPSGETDFEVSLLPFSPGTIAMFKQIERPAETPEAKAAPKSLQRMATAPKRAFLDLTHATEKRRARAAQSIIPVFHVKREGGAEAQFHYWSIGEFYAAIREGFEDLVKELGGKAVFTGKAERQVGPEAFSTGGGKVIKVHDLATAIAAIDEIIEQGEGSVGHVINKEGELSHYARFDQIQRGRRYNVWQNADGTWESDPLGDPQGDPLPIYWEEVYPFLPNAKVANYPEKTDIHEAAVSFNLHYREFLNYLQAAFNGSPKLMLDSYRFMFKFRDDITKLIRHPFPVDSAVLTAAPTFEC